MRCERVTHVLCNKLKQKYNTDTIWKQNVEEKFFK